MLAGSLLEYFSKRVPKITFEKKYTQDMIEEINKNRQEIRIEWRWLELYDTFYCIDSMLV